MRTIGGEGEGSTHGEISIIKSGMCALLYAGEISHDAARTFT